MVSVRSHRVFAPAIRFVFLLLFTVPVFHQCAFSQNISSYNFSEAAATFTTITATAGVTTDFTSGDDAVTGAITIPFSFTYKGVAYTTCKVSTNGFLTMGAATTPGVSVYTPVSDATASYNTAISAVGTDLVSTIRHNTTGTAPNRVFVVEWYDAYRFNVSSAEHLNFQVRLYETTNVVEIVFGAVSTSNTNFATGAAETGLKGGPSDFNTVSFTNPTLTGYSYTNDWNSLITSNLQTDKTGITSTVYPASGTTLRWTPATCTQVSVAASVSAITNATALVSWTNSATYASGYLVRWRKVNDPYSFPTWSSPVAVSAGVSSYTISGLTGNAYYIFSVEGRCSSGSINNFSTVTTANTTNGKGLFKTGGCVAIPALIQVGPTSLYPTLQSALAVLNSCPITQPTVVELQPNYNPVLETYPLLITGNPGASAFNTITIRPAAGAGPFTLINVTAQDMLILRGAKYYRIDGRPGGTGTSQNLSFIASGGNSTVTLSDEAQNNIIRYLNLKTQVTGTNFGVVQISDTYATGISAGNNNNLIANCNINGGGVSACGIYEKSSLPPADNKSNTISNNNIFDYFYDGSFSTPNAGIAFMNTTESKTPGYDWTITGNSMFETTSRTYNQSAGWYGVFYDEDNSIDHNATFKISNNFIGGTAPLCAGAPFTITQLSMFSRGTNGIAVTDGYSSNSRIQANTITNFSVITNSQYAAFTGVVLSSGNAIIDGNTIGSTLAAGAVTFFSNATTNVFFSGISAYNNVAGFQSPIIRNNKMSGFSASGSAHINITGISTAYGVGPDNLSYTILNNEVGYPGVPITNQSPGTIFGIATLGTAGATISGNTVTNLNITNTTGTASYIYGIQADYGDQIVGSQGAGNLVYNLNSSASGGIYGDIFGIVYRGTSGSGSSIAYNQVYGLHLSGPLPGKVFGISGSGSGQLVANNNRIYGEDVTASAAGSQIAGISVTADTALVYNNLISLGTLSPAVSAQFTGIYENSSKIELYHNSVYIGGNNVTGGTSNSYALRSAGAVHLIKNNIFFNARSNGTSAGKHYAFSVANVSAAGNLNNNDYYAPGTGGFLGNYTTTDFSTMAQVRSVTGQDAQSVSADPKFNAPAAVSPDLTINVATASVLESGAVPVAAVTTDYSGAVRNVYTPDIGAYEISGTPGFPVIGNITGAGATCTATAHIILATITAGAVTLSAGTVTLNYSYNGIAQTPLLMTYYGGTLWGATIPAATPANANVTFYISANDGNYTINKPGIAYNDVASSLVTAVATASPAAICQGGSSVLKVDVNGPGPATIGNGSGTLGTPTASEALSPLSQYYEGQHTQYLVLAADLTAAGLRAGNITSLSFNVTAKNSTKPFTNYKIKLGSTALTTLSNGNNSASFYTVYQAAATAGTGYIGSIGTNTFPFGTGNGTVAAFAWNGTSNILLDVCFENDPLNAGTYYSNVDVVTATTKGYTATYGYYQDNSSLCGAAIVNVSSSTKLPDFSFYGSNVILTPSSYSWSDGATTVGSTNNISVSPAVTTNYTATVNVNGCPAVSNQTTVTVSNVAVTAQPVSVAKCSGSNTSFTVAASGAVSAYQWQVSTDGFTWNNLTNGILYGGVTTATLSLTGISTGLNSYRYRVLLTGCGPAVYSDGTATLTVNSSPVVSISSSAAAVCIGTTSAVNLTASGASTYSWSPAATLSSGSGAVVSASPLTTTGYTVTGTAANSCTASATYAVNVLQSPRIASYAGTTSTICAGSSATLSVAAAATDIAALPNAYLFAQTSTTYVQIAGSVLANGTGDDTGNGNLPIGFNFYYNNAAHSVFSAGSNGLMILGDATPSYTSGYPYDNELAITSNIIAPFWDDNNTTGGNIQYLTTGTAPTRVLTVQWTGMHTGGSGSATSATVSCQVQLTEGSNAIRFIYGAPSTLLNFVTASIGISGGSGNFISVTPGSPAAASTATENTGVSAAVPSGTVYSFSPPATALSYAWSPAVGLTPNATGASVTTPAINAPATYNVSVANGACASSGSVSILVRPANTWLGVNSNWFDGQNWCPGVPTSSSDVTIPAGASFYPLINSFGAGYASVRNITIQPGASVTVSGSGRFSLSGAINNNGIFDLSDGSLALSGISQNLLPNSITGRTVKNLFMNAPSATLNFVDNSGGQLRIKDSLSFLSSNNTLQVNASIVLGSTAAKTASLTDITANGTLTGNEVYGDVVVERYIKAGRKWRFLSVPTGTQQTVKNAWMENNTPGGNTGAAGYGTWITDPGGTANGFDAASVSASMKQWNGTSYTGISNVNATLLTLNGYMVYVRGDRSIPNTGSATSVTTLRTSGALYQGNYPLSGISIPAGGGITDVGNIYASAIDLSKMNWGVTTATPIQVLLWDPFLGTGSAYGLGAFQTLTRVSGQNDFVITPGGGSYAGVNSGDVMNKIESGQAFFVQGGVLPNSIQFKETAKGIGEHLVSFTGNAPQNLFGRLYFRSDSSYNLADGFGVMTNESQAVAHTNDDATKQVNTGENVSVRQGDSFHSVDMRSLIAVHDTIFINMANMHLNAYRWEIDSRNLDKPGREGFLVDKFTGTSNLLNLAGVTPYSFSVTNDVNSYAADRFMIVFKPLAILALPGLTTAASQPDLSAQRVTISPNPVENKTLRIQLIKMKKGGYQCAIHDAAGRLIRIAKIQITSAKQNESIALGNAAPGNYFVEIRKGDEVILTENVVIL